MINWDYKDKKLFSHKRYWQKKEKLYRLGGNTNHISNKGLISKIYKELLILNSTKKKNLHFLNGQNIWINTSPKKKCRRCTHNKHVKKVPNLLATREMQIKTIRYYYTHLYNEILQHLPELMMDREAWHAAVHGVTNSQTWLSDWTELNWYTPNKRKKKIRELRTHTTQWLSRLWTNWNSYILLVEIQNSTGTLKNSLKVFLLSEIYT